MKFGPKAALAAAFILGSTAIAVAQGSIDRNGNANGSQGVGNGGAMQGGTSGTTGMSAGSGAERGSPNGSAGAAPKATTGPQGDPSKSESGKH